MNTIKNDRGETVYAVGAPGSAARALCQYPALLEKVHSLRLAFANYEEVVAALREAGVVEAYEIRAVVEASWLNWDDEGEF
jgi:hypothetical protein